MKKLLFLLVAAFAAAVFAAEETAVDKNVSKESAVEKPAIQPPAEKRYKRPPRPGFQKAHGTWMAFAELSAEERQAMLKLQREDPEKFRIEMHKLAEKFFKAEKLRRKEFAELVNKYKSTSDDKIKSEIHEQIKSRVKENFKRRLRQSRMHLDELKKQVKVLENELDIREKAEDKIVEATVNNIVSGKPPKFGHPRHRRPMFPAKRPAPLKAE